MSIESNTFNQSRTKRQYSYVGEEHAAKVVEWLNGAHDITRLAEILFIMQFLEKEIAGREKESKQAAAWRTLLNRKLSRFRLFPVLLSSYRLGFRNVGKGTFVRGEDMAVMAIVEGLFPWGLAHRVRRCKQCQKWFFARVERKQYCTTACLQKAFTQREEFKTKRAEYMRKHRKDLKGRKWQFK